MPDGADEKILTLGKYRLRLNELSQKLGICHSCEHFGIEDKQAVCTQEKSLIIRVIMRGGCAKHVIERATYIIPDDYDVEDERRRLKHGGCCGSPSKDA